MFTYDFGYTAGSNNAQSKIPISEHFFRVAGSNNAANVGLINRLAKINQRS